MIQLSAVIITYNEEKNIGRCLLSLQGVVDEIVVVDSMSTDTTIAICNQYGVRIISHAFEGHIQQKNYAASQASYEWVLSLDADECLDETLRNEIIRVKNSVEVDGYSMNRLTNYCGQWIKHGGWYPDIKLRLWNRHQGQWGGINPHDKFELYDSAAPNIHLKGNILHYSYYTIEEHRNRSMHYAEISAQHLFELKKNISMPMIFIKTISKFIRNYFLHAGFLDGAYGYTIAIISAQETHRKYRLLKELHKKSLLH